MLEPGRAAGPLDGQVALITGSSSGLGKATAIALAQAGADVALLARGKDDLERAAAEVTPVGRRALVLVADLTLAEELTEAVDQMLERFGRVDVLVNAAGTDRPGPVIELGVDDWDQVLAVNLRAPFVLAKAVFPRMRQAGRGTIVNVSSVAGKRGWANAAAYCASKFGLSGLTQALWPPRAGRMASAPAFCTRARCPPTGESGRRRRENSYDASRHLAGGRCPQGRWRH